MQIFIKLLKTTATNYTKKISPENNNSKLLPTGTLVFVVEGLICKHLKVNVIQDIL